MKSEAGHQFIIIGKLALTPLATGRFINGRVA
jgi:hypothetical protein